MKKKIKILQVIDAYEPTVDGAISVVKNYAKSLSNKATCKVLGPKPAKKVGYVDDEVFEVIRVKSVSAPEGYRFPVPSFDRKLKKFLKEEKFDIIHAQSPFSLGRYTLKYAKKNNIPFVATLHTQYHRDFERVVGKLLAKIPLRYIMKVFNKADSVWTVSEGSVKYLRDYGYKGKVEVVRNGTDMTYPDNPEELVEKVNSKHNLYGQKNVFLFVGRMAFYKNLKLLINSLKILKDEGLDYKMIFVGGGFDYEEVIKYAEEKDVFDKCIFTGAVYDKELLKGYYLRADLFTLPSTFDMAPITKEEAAVMKLPCVVIDGSCSSERVVDGENGYIAKEDEKDFARVIKETCKSEEKRKRVGENACRSLYRNWDMVTDEVLSKYQTIIAEYRKTHNIK